MNEVPLHPSYLNELEFMIERSEKYWGVSRESFLSQTAHHNLYCQIQRGYRLFDKISGGRCCPKAEQVPCMCEISYTCPDHGTRCRGSHD